MGKAKITREAKKAEAIKRMKILGIAPNLISLFEKEDIIFVSQEPIADNVLLSQISDTEKQMVKEFEEETNSLVYHIIKNKTNYGTLLSFFDISDYEEDWELERAAVKQNVPMVYVKNLDYEFNSEYGSINIKSLDGGLIRLF